MAIHRPQTTQEFETLLEQVGSQSWIGFFSADSELARLHQPTFEAVAARAKRPTIIVDVTKVRGVHSRYGVSSVPTIVALDGDRVLERIVGGHTEDGYAEALNVAPAPKHDSHGREIPTKPRVKVYVTETCPWCTRVKSYLKQHGVAFSEVNVSRDERAAKEMVRRSGQQGVPQVEINGRMIVGFDKPAIDSMLGLKAGHSA